MCLYKMGKKEISSKTLTYMFDPDENYVYNINHGTDYPYNGFPTGLNGRKYKKTRFIKWEPLQEDIIMRHYGSQIFVNFMAVLPNDVLEPEYQLFQLRAKRVDLQNLICEQINFFTALYDDDNDLISSMLIAKYMTDKQRLYTIETFEDYYKKLYDTLFPERTIKKIRLMVEENDVGDDTVGLFPVSMLKDVYMLSFMIKVMHIFIEHFIISTGNSPKNSYEYFAKCVTYMMNKINPNMYILLYNYVNKSVQQTVSSNSNIYDMQAIDGVTIPTTTQSIMRKILLCDGLIKLTFASEWDNVNKRPTYSCVGLIKAIVTQATFLTRKIQLRYSLVNVDDVSQLLSDSISSSSPISCLRAYNPGEYCCMLKDLRIIIAEIALQIDLSPVDYYLNNLPQMNDLSKILIKIVLYNKFHSSLSTDTLSMKQKYILLLYVRHLIMKMYSLTEEDTTGNVLINIIMGKTVSHTNKTLTPKDLNGIKKYIKLNNLKYYLLSEKNVNTIIENIQNCVQSSYTIVNHNNHDLLDAPLVYESSSMTFSLLDIIVQLFEMMDPNNPDHI